MTKTWKWLNLYLTQLKPKTVLTLHDFNPSMMTQPPIPWTKPKYDLTKDYTNLKMTKPLWRGHENYPTQSWIQTWNTNLSEFYMNVNRHLTMTQPRITWSGNNKPCLGLTLVNPNSISTPILTTFISYQLYLGWSLAMHDCMWLSFTHACIRGLE